MMIARQLISAGGFDKDVVEKVMYVVLSQADLVLTAFAVHAGFYELNPLVRNLLAAPVMLILIKGAIPLFVAWLAPGKLLLPAIGVLVLVVGWNVKELVLWLW